MTSISDVLKEFLDQASRRPVDDGMDDATRAIIELLESYLDSYGHTRLDEEEGELWQRRYDEDEEEGAFSKIFGPEKISDGIDDFLNWFVIRKVLGPSWIADEAGSVCKELIAWLEHKGYISKEAAEETLEVASQAARELPDSERLSLLLYEVTEKPIRGAITQQIDAVDQMAYISRIESGKLWFQIDEGEIGPIRVPVEASRLARLGWGVTACHFAKTRSTWYLIEMGNVYPQG